MTEHKEIPVIFRKTNQGSIIALLPTMPTSGINSACIAYSEKYGFFASDISIMRLTSDTDSDNVWPILASLIQEGIKPIRVYKRIMTWMNETRLKAMQLEEIQTA